MDAPMGRVILLALVVLALAAVGVVGMVAAAQRAFGAPAPWLTLPQVIQYSARLLWADGLLTKSFDPNAPEQGFEVETGESVSSVCARLQESGLVVDAAALRDYLIYTGKDTSLQAGDYRLSAAMSAVEVAARMQDATPGDVEFVVLPGWRLEEIAETLPTSGLNITPEEFMAEAAAPRTSYAFLSEARTTEGFLYPGSYILPRSTTIDGLLDALLTGFADHVDPQLQQDFASHDLSIYQAVTLASIVEREAVRAEEAPLIASVYLNRLGEGMRLDADPTVQYAIGFNTGQHTWWTNPLSLGDLQVASDYNTYQITGLPPGPIANPGMGALQAVAAPAASPYFYFNARCDGSGFHIFAVDFQQHLDNLCQ